MDGQTVVVGGSSFSGASLGCSGGGTIRGSGGAQTYSTSQYQTPRDTGSNSRYDQKFPPFRGGSSAGNDHMHSDPPFTPMDYTSQQSRGDQDDNPTPSTSTARLERDELRAQLAQALASVNQLTRQNALLLNQINTLQRQIQEEREERIQMQ